MLSPFRFVRAMLLAVMPLSVTVLLGCQTAPKSEQSREILQDKARLAVREMEAADPSLHDFLTNRAYAYAVFPEVGKGGVIVGGAYGRGTVFRKGDFLGYVELNQGSIGLQLGAKTFSEILAFADEPTFNEVRNRGEFTLGANVSATAIKSGAAGAVNFQDGMAAFVRPNGGLMVDLSINGQKINFKPANNGDKAGLKINNDPAFKGQVNTEVRNPNQ